MFQGIGTQSTNLSRNGNNSQKSLNINNSNLSSSSNEDEDEDEEDNVPWGERIKNSPNSEEDDKESTYHFFFKIWEFKD